MAKLTWLGTDGSEQGDEYIPLAPCTWCGVTFEVGQPVEVTDETMIRKARGNHFFRVEEDVVPEPQSFFGPEQSLPIGLIRPEAWTNTPPGPFPDYPPNPPSLAELRAMGGAPPREEFDNPPDYPPEDDPDREPKKRRGRPPRIRDNGNGDQ